MKEDVGPLEKEAFGDIGHSLGIAKIFILGIKTPD